MFGGEGYALAMNSEDRDAIVQLKARYFRLMDTKDWLLMMLTTTCRF